ncbi:MAG: tyrosine--tRNA ligase [bacterium]|nr:tyrosine--tRNA ligase [bacterium]
MPETNKELVKELLERGIDKVYPSKEELEKALLSGRRLRIYLGADATGPHLHFGHATNFLTLKRLQQLGHEIIFLIGDFTSQIGDPTDKASARQPLTRQQIKANFKTFKKQAAKFIKFGWGGAKVRFNSSWLGEMSFADVVRLAQNFTVQQMIQRDMFQERIKADKPIGLHEFLYPLMQGYDSVAMDVDLEVGGTDQTFNMLVGRDLQKKYKNKEKFVLTTKLLVNPATDKKLMNKSEGGLINLDDSPEDIFGKVMAIDDAGMFALAEFSTEMPMAEIAKLKEQVEGGMNPRDAKFKIAAAAVELLYGVEGAKQAQENFVKIFSEHDKPTDIPMKQLAGAPRQLVDLLVEVELAPSKSEARRLIEQGAVKIDDVKKTDPTENIKIDGEILLQVGKRHFLRLSRP